MNVFDNLAGALEIMLGRDHGLQRLDLTADGFWRSFAGLGLMAIIDVAAFMATHPQRLTSGEIKTVSALQYSLLSVAIVLIAYGASLVALYVMCRSDHTRTRFPVAVIAHNWATPVIALAFMPLVVMTALFVPADGGSTLGGMMLIGLLAIMVIVSIRLIRIPLGISQLHAGLMFLGVAGTSLVLELWLSKTLGL